MIFCFIFDKEDFIVKGIKICLLKCVGIFFFKLVIVYFYKLFKFFYLLCFIIGCGYLGNMVEVFILFVYCVLILLLVGFYCVYIFVVKKVNNRDKIRKFFIIV